MSLNNELPRWDMGIIFPSLNSPEFHSAFQSVDLGIENLEDLFLRLDIKKGSRSGKESFDEVISAFNKVSEEIRTVKAYIYAFTTTDSRDELASAKESEIDLLLSRLRNLSKQFAAWVGGLDLTEIIAASEVARGHEYALRKFQVSAEHLMGPYEETLASDLELTGIIAWAKLHGNMTSQLMVPILIDEELTELPMSIVRNFAYDAERNKRKQGYEAELAAWKSVEVPLAASMNGVKGEVSTLCRHRKWQDPLEEALFHSNIDRSTLTAMLAAAEESFPIFRRYLSAKAKALKLETLAFYDLFAPIVEGTNSWDYASACKFVVEQFRSYSDDLAGFAARAFEENWIDAAPYAGKSDGAYCMSVRGDESRILMNYKPSFGSVSTLAHELGHAYHNFCLQGKTALQRTTPMTLAETASIFCETIIRQGVLKKGSTREQLVVLEASLQGSCQVVVDISSRYLFEKSVFDARSKRELSPRELCELMTQAQLDTYGDGLDSEQLHPYMWAAKSHYYGRSYYNFPYMFGLLFGLGLFSLYQSNPEPFKANYKELLASTGSADAATLGNRFGIDITKIDFWRGSLKLIEDDVYRFEMLVAELG